MTFSESFTISFNKQTILSLDKESKVMKIDSRFCCLRFMVLWRAKF